MTFGAGDSNGQQNGRVEYVQFGSPRRERRRGRGWLSRLLLGCLVVAAVVVVAAHWIPRRAPAQPALPPLPPVEVTDVGHPLLGVKAGWELFGLDTDGVVAIQLASGRITRTALPPPAGSGPVSFIVGPRAAIVRPLDKAPGYLVPDGDQARPLTGVLASGDMLLPGPQPEQEWVIGDSTSTLSLLGAAGRSSRIGLFAADWAVQSAMSDGRGDVLVAGAGGAQYDVSPNSLWPVGALLEAVGPKRWLGVSCRHGRCQDVVIDAATGARRILPGPPLQFMTWPWPYEPGAAAPDGSAAAVVVASGGRSALDLISLSSGAVTRIPVPVTQQTSSQTLVWSPDSQWLFVVAADGKLLAVSARSHRVESLGVPLPDFSQLAIRTAPGKPT